MNEKSDERIMKLFFALFVFFQKIMARLSAVRLIPCVLLLVNFSLPFILSFDTPFHLPSLKRRKLLISLDGDASLPARVIRSTLDASSGISLFSVAILCDSPPPSRISRRKRR